MSIRISFLPGTRYSSTITNESHLSVGLHLLLTTPEYVINEKKSLVFSYFALKISAVLQMASYFPHTEIPHNTNRLRESP